MIVGERMRNEGDTVDLIYPCSRAVILPRLYVGGMPKLRWYDRKAETLRSCGSGQGPGANGPLVALCANRRYRSVAEQLPLPRVPSFSTQMWSCSHQESHSTRDDG